MTWRQYSKDDFSKLKYRFDGDETVQRNFSQAFQDMFVLTMLDGKRNGFYLEIGGALPQDINNTYLLETAFGWRGLSVERDPGLASAYNALRHNKTLQKDALQIDYTEWLKDAPEQIDYLSIDIEPAKQTLAALRKVLEAPHRFSVITYETDLYQSPDGLPSRKILESSGYQMVVKNISTNQNAFEDWWVDPSVVPESVWIDLVDIADECTYAPSVILNLD